MCLFLMESKVTLITLLHWNSLQSDPVLYNSTCYKNSHFILTCLVGLDVFAYTEIVLVTTEILVIMGGKVRN